MNYYYEIPSWILIFCSFSASFYYCILYYHYYDRQALYMTNVYSQIDKGIKYFFCFFFQHNFLKQILNLIHVTCKKVIIFPTTHKLIFVQHKDSDRNEKGENISLWSPYFTCNRKCNLYDITIIIIKSGEIFHLNNFFFVSSSL